MRTEVPVSGGFVTVYASSPLGEPRGRCLVGAPFGLPASALAIVERHLVDAGFSVMRFDPRDHVGAGSGEMADYRISTVTEDCSELIDLLQPTCVLAISMGAKAALRALADGEHHADAVLVTPVVSVRDTLRAILGADWFAVDHGEVPDPMLVLDHEIRAVQFRRDCELHGLVDLEGTIVDLLATPGRVRVVAGSHDPWVDRHAVRRALSLIEGRGRMTVVPAVTHLLHLDPDLAVRMIDAAVEQIIDLHAARPPS
ncbi:MAG: alpha/beta fold hydrolase [Actinomycetota bacterium]